MGLFRKMTSVSTLGAVDFRSDKERIARYTRQTRDATRALVDQQADDDAEFREFQQWKAERNRAVRPGTTGGTRPNQTDTKKALTGKTVSWMPSADEEVIARQERERRAREGNGRQSSSAYDTLSMLGAIALVLGTAVSGFGLITFVVLEIVGVRMGWWWAAIIAPAFIASYFMDDST